MNLALEKIEPPHVAQKETAVLRLAEATATGVSWNQMFREKRVPCSKKAWFDWKKEAPVAAALEAATARARWWMRVKRGGAVEKALDALTDAADGAAAQLEADELRTAAQLERLSDARKETAGAIAGLDLALQALEKSKEAF